LPAFAKAAQRSDNPKYIILFRRERGFGGKTPREGFFPPIKNNCDCACAIAAALSKNKGFRRLFFVKYNYQCSLSFDDLISKKNGCLAIFFD